MGTPVLIIGESGSGKTTSIRGMNPETTGIVSAIKKPLPFKSQFKTPYVTDDYKKIMSLLPLAEAPNIIIDDVQYLMANEYMRRSKEKGYDKFTEIGKNFWDLINRVVYDTPDDKIVFFLGHTETTAEGKIKFKTIGKMLDEKITIEGMFTIVLKTFVSDDRNYYFATQNNGFDTAKSPVGMFDEQYIPNDLGFVEKKIREFYGIELSQNKKGGKTLV